MTVAAKKTRPRAGRKNSALRKLRPTCRLPSGVVLKSYRAEQVQHLRRLVSEPMECVYDPTFRRRRELERVRRDAQEATARRARRLAELAARSRKGSVSQTLTAEEERALFLRMNYCRYRVMRILHAHAGKRLMAETTRQLLEWDEQARLARDEIVNANVGLVPTMIERSRITGVDFGELISEGQLALLRSVDKFDVSRGFKFSTYACRAILTSMTRAVALMARHRSRFPTEFDPALQRGDVIEIRRAGLEEDCLVALQAALRDNRALLSATEQRVLAERFGLRGGKRFAEQKTLRQVAEQFGVTRERIRQIQNKALQKLRGVIDERVFAA